MHPQGNGLKALTMSHGYHQTIDASRNFWTAPMRAGTMTSMNVRKRKKTSKRKFKASNRNNNDVSPCLDPGCLCRDADKRGYVSRNIGSHRAVSQRLPPTPATPNSGLGIFAPRDMRFEVHRRPDGTADFMYAESDSDHPKAVKNTYLLLKQSLGANKKGPIKVQLVNRDTVKVSGERIPFRAVADMLVSEFLQWSSLGEVTVREMWMSKMMIALASPAINAHMKQSGVKIGIDDGAVNALANGDRQLTKV